MSTESTSIPLRWTAHDNPRLPIGPRSDSARHGRPRDRMGGAWLRACLSSEVHVPGFVLMGDGSFMGVTGYKLKRNPLTYVNIPWISSIMLMGCSLSFLFKEYWWYIHGIHKGNFLDVDGIHGILWKVSTQAMDDLTRYSPVGHQAAYPLSCWLY